MTGTKDQIAPLKSGARRSGGRPKRDEAALIEARIVEAARVLFFSHGYGATSIETIARSADVSKRTFYNRFENKAAIFRAVVNGLVSRVKPHDVDGLFEGASGAEILQRIARVLLGAALSPEALSLHRVVVAEATRFPELALVMNQQGARQDGIARIAKLLTAEADAGRLKIEDPVMAAEMFMQLVIGLPQRRALGMGVPMAADELDHWAKGAVDLFLHGCRVK